MTRAPRVGEGRGGAGDGRGAVRGIGPQGRGLRLPPGPTAGLAFVAGLVSCAALRAVHEAISPPPDPRAAAPCDEACEPSAPTPPPVAAPSYTRRVVGSPSEPPGIARLRALGYASHAAAPSIEPDGVVERVHGASYGAVTLLTSGEFPGAFLVDLDGREVHRWSHGEETWIFAHPYPDGGLLAVVNDHRLLRLDARSRVLWTLEARVHHACAVASDGTIYALSRRTAARPAVHPTNPVLLDELLVVAPDGRVARAYSLLDAVQRSPYAFLVPSVAHLREWTSRSPFDLLHTNHVELLDGSHHDAWEEDARDHVLLSFRNLHALAVLDLVDEELHWLWGPSNLTFQHAPRVLPSGRLLLFDNGTSSSRVIEVEPESGRIHTVYAPPGFFSEMRGAAQRLPNGNTLVTNSDSGELLEVTPEGRLVWRYLNPRRDAAGRREAIFRADRFSLEELPFAGSLLPAP